MGRRGGDIFEVSNLGCLSVEPDGVSKGQGGEDVKNGENGREKGAWSVDRLIFTQSGQTTASAIAFNAVGLRDGPFVLSVAWLDGPIEEKFVRSVLGDIEAGLRRISGEISS